MSSHFSKFTHQQSMQLASLAIIALAIPLGILATQTPQILSGLAAPKDLHAPPTSSCRVTGCSNELCVDADYVPLDSDCSVSPKYASCLADAPCVLKTDGSCGFELTTDIQACLAQNNLTTHPETDSLILTPHFESGLLERNYQAVISATPGKSLQHIEVFNLPQGLTSACKQDSCTIAGIPQEPGHHQILVSATSTSGFQEQQLVPLTIRAGGTLERIQ